MNAAEKEKIRHELQSSRVALAEALGGVDEGLAVRKPAFGGWSILECVEHVAVTERYLLTRLQAASRSEEPFEKTRREEKIARLAADRGRRIEAPEPAHPRGRFKTLAVALEAFDATRSDVVRWLDNCGDDLRCLMTDHLLIEGPVTCAEMLIMIAAHPTRHAKQISEIREQFSAER